MQRQAASAPPAACVRVDGRCLQPRTTCCHCLPAGDKQGPFTRKAPDSWSRVCSCCPAEEEERRIGLGAQQRRGIIRTVAGAPLSLVRGMLDAGHGPVGDRGPSGDDSLADQWLDFLIQQAEADAKDGGSGGKQLAAEGQGGLAAGGQLQTAADGPSPFQQVSPRRSFGRHDWRSLSNPVSDRAAGLEHTPLSD